MQMIEIDVIDEQNDLPLQTEQVKAIVCEVIAYEEEACDEVAVYFVDTARISELHQQFFGDPSTTDCISLPMDEEEDDYYRHLGDIFVCPNTAKEYVNTHGGSPYEEVTLYIVHGLLHLMGYDDVDEQDQVLMREAENRHMRHLKEKGLCLSIP